MKANLILTRQANHIRRPLGLFLMVLALLSAASLLKPGEASSASPRGEPLAGDNCSNATVISPGAFVFTEESSLAGAGNDIDPGPGGCAPGGGNDVVYSFTPSVTSVYTIGATPTTPFDLSLYIVTDCSNPAGTCIAGKNARGFDSGEFLTPTLTAGTRYFIVVDSVNPDPNAGSFHFSLRRGLPTNDTCATAAVIDPSRLPFSASSTTFGANNDLDPGQSCLTSPQSTRGPDLVYQFTSGDTQVYNIVATPVGHYDLSLYVTTDCASIASCSGSDIGGLGDAETVRRNLTAGTTYFIVVDGFGGDAGDFSLTVTPSI